jgi:LNR domain
MSFLLLSVILTGCTASVMPALCLPEALQSRCTNGICPITMAPNEHIAIFFNHSSIQLNYTMSGTSQDWIKTLVMDQKNYRSFLANHIYAYNNAGSEVTAGAEGACKTNILENTKGIGSVLVLMCVYASSSLFNCTVWYNHSYIVFVDRCAPSCVTGMAANGVCDAFCDVAACGYDGGDCPAPTTVLTGMCSAGCYPEMVGDGTCNSECDNSRCNYDNGDCPVNTNPAPLPSPPPPSTSFPSSSSRSPSALFATTQGATPQMNRGVQRSVF